MLSVMPHALGFHADLETLLESAVGATLPRHLVDDTLVVGLAPVLLLVLHSPFEELLARLARQQSIVVPAHLVPAHRTRLPDEFPGLFPPSIVMHYIYVPFHYVPFQCITEICSIITLFTFELKPFNFDALLL